MTPLLRHCVAQVLPARITTRLARLTPARVSVPDGGRFRMHTDNGDGIAGRLWWHGVESYEPETMAVWLKLARTAPWVVDVGANTGVFTLSAAAVSLAPVLAFEPLPEVAAELRRNVELNGFAHATVVEAAVSAAAGTGVLYVPAAGLSLESSLLADHRPVDHEVEVPIVTLDLVAAEHALSGPGLVKIDTEATEHLVLRGATAVLQNLRPTLVVEVLPGRTEEDLRPLLVDHDYAALWLGSGDLPERPLEGDRSERFLNWLFVPGERVVEVRRQA